MQLTYYMEPIKVKSPKLKKILDDVIADHIGEHFNEHGWPLALDGIKEAVLFKLLGYHISDVMYAYILQNHPNLAIQHNADFSSSNVACLVDLNYQPVYINKKTGKIVLPEKDYKKDFINFLVQHDFLGRL